jgi:disulfide bond formation protein DsbB
MQSKTIVITSFSHPAVESHIFNLDAELNDFAKLQGKEDAQKDSMLTETLFNIKIKEHVRSKIQMAIDFIKNILLVTSMVFDAAEIDRIAQKKVQEINNEINDRLHSRGSLKRKVASIIIDPLKKKYGKWLTVIALCVGAGDAALAFGSFRHGAFTVLQALLAALAIGAIISVSHLLYARWIKRAKTETQRVFRILLMLSVAFTFFAWIGNLRAQAANNTVSIALDGNNVSSVSSPHLNGWAIAIISFVLFSAVLFLSLLLWKSKEERLKEQEHEKLIREISVIDAEINALEKQKIDIENKAAIQKSEARKIFDYAISSIRRCKNIGQGAISKYKQTYARFHNDIVPAFFADQCDLSYDESFQFSKPQKQETV